MPGCGGIFETLLQPYITGRDDHDFHLEKGDHTRMRQRSRFSEVKLETERGQIAAGIAHSWARRGIPMRSYGKEIKTL